MIVGFTGTREGMSEAQKLVVRGILVGLDASIGIHGDCVGADADFHGICLDHQISVHLFPGHPKGRPDDLSMRAGCEIPKGHEGRVYAARPYLDRNRAIVDACDMLIGCPKNEQVSAGSGTWYTIDYARKQGRNVTIIYPSGAVRSK